MNLGQEPSRRRGNRQPRNRKTGSQSKTQPPNRLLLPPPALNCSPASSKKPCSPPATHPPPCMRPTVTTCACCCAASHPAFGTLGASSACSPVSSGISNAVRASARLREFRLQTSHPPPSKVAQPNHRIDGTVSLKGSPCSWPSDGSRSPRPCLDGASPRPGARCLRSPWQPARNSQEHPSCLFRPQLPPMRRKRLP